MSIDLQSSSDLSKTEWDKNLDKIGGFSLYHTHDQVNFYIKTSDKIKNLSFFCLLNKEPIAFTPLGLTSHKTFNSLSFNQYPCHVSIIDKNLIPRTRRKVEEVIYKKINNIIDEKKIKYADFFYHPIVINNEATLNYEDSFSILKYFDVKINSINSGFLNLSERIQVLESKLQRSLRKEINNEVYQKLNIIIVDENSNSNEIDSFVDKARYIHFENAKKETRNVDSWEFMKVRIKNGSSTLFFLENNKNLIAYLWCTEIKGVFASAASQASIKNKFYLDNSVRFYLEWCAINFYNKKKFKFYEIGQHYYFNQNWMNISSKQKRIGLSKLKFGGSIYPRHYFRYEGNNNVFKNNEYI
jgi:hypothetical protein